jgi:hypothetical protein
MTVVGGFRHGGIQGRTGMGEAVSEVKAVIRAEAAELVKSDNWRGPDWWQLSEAEEYVFDIEADRFPLMIMTLHAYEAFTETSEGAPMDMKHEAMWKALRAARPDIIAKGLCFEGFWAFVTDYGEIRQREAWQIFIKNEFWQLRLGVTVFSDDEADPEPGNKRQSPGDMDDDIPF